MTNKSNFKKWTFFVAILMIFSAVMLPTTQGITIKNRETKEDVENIESSAVNEMKSVSIVLHRIREHDELDPGTEADWTIRMYINEERKSYNVDGDDEIKDKKFTWEEIVSSDTETIDIKMELKERDLWFDDIADISAHEGGGKDDSEDFDKYRGAVFKRTFNINTNQWMPVDENNDYIMIDDEANVQWYKTSGNFDGSTKKDENDASVWFNIFVQNEAPYAPEKPQGPTSGDVNRPYTFTTRCRDPDGDKIKYGWDWDGDGRVDEVTDYYESWSTCTITHTWHKPGIYLVKVLAIDEYGMTSELSEPLTVEIASPDGKSGMKMEDTWYGEVYTIYLDHRETQDLVRTIKQGSKVIAAVAALITAVAAAAGIPIEIGIATAIATAIVRIGAEGIQMMDMHNKGVYFKVHVIQLWGTPITSFGYVWSQK